MEPSGSSFKGVEGDSLRPCRSLSQSSLTFNLCLRLVRLLLVLLFCVFIAEAIQESSADPAEVSQVLPSNFKIKPGEDLSLSCNVTAISPVNLISWTFNGAILKDSTNMTSLNISKAQCSDTGIYRCFPSNGLLPTAKNGTFYVTVADKPGKVNFSTHRSTPTSLSFQWTAPLNGCLVLNYVIHYYDQKNRQTKNISTDQKAMLTGLKPYTEYVVSLWAWNNEGHNHSENLTFRTDIGVPSEPLSLELNSSSCQIEARWKIPHHKNGPDLSYRLSYKESNFTNWTHIENIKNKSYSLSKEIVCSNLKVQCLYSIKVTANNSAGYGNGSNITMVTVLLQDCGTSSTKKGKEYSDWVTVVIVLAIICTLIGVIILVICLRRKCRSCNMPFKGFFTFEQATTPSVTRDSSFKEKREREAVPYEKFWQHVTLRHADSNYRFSSEFESVQGIHEKNKKLTWIQSQRPENQPKNRFANVVAYDQTRVLLSTIDGIQGSHYINANYVDSYKAMNFYIATQGPLSNTIADFWRMVWEQNSKVVVMITKIIEKGRHKCTQYWPTKNRKTADHGPLRVTFLREEHFAFYTVREFEIKPIKEGTHYSQDSTDEAVKPMVVQHFHFTGWPDHGVPEPGYEIPVLDFIFKSTAAQVEGAGPIIVHCR